MTDSEKLFAICKTVWPKEEWRLTHRYSGSTVSNAKSYVGLSAESRDSLSCVLAALTPGQQQRFNEEMSPAISGTVHTAWYHLTMPPMLPLWALYRALIGPTQPQ